MIYVGIDPGAKGGVAFVSPEEAFVIPMPDIYEFNELIMSWERDYRIKHVCLERAQAMPKQGVTSMFSYGNHYGMLQGVLVAHKIPYSLVPPKEWQAEMFKGSKEKTGSEKRDPKERALEIVRRIFPKQSFLASLKCKKPHDGMIDSILLADFCRRKMLG